MNRPVAFLVTGRFLFLDFEGGKRIFYRRDAEGAEVALQEMADRR